MKLDEYVDFLIENKQIQIDNCNQKLQEFTEELNLLIAIKRKVRESEVE